MDQTTADYSRMAELVENYSDLLLGTTDASVIAIAERFKLTDVASLDRRHFTVVRPSHMNSLTLLLPRPPRSCQPLAVADVSRLAKRPRSGVAWIRRTRPRQSCSEEEEITCL